MNAWDQVTIGSTPQQLFRSVRSGGGDLDGAMSITVVNQHTTEDMLIVVSGFHYTVPNGTQYGEDDVLPEVSRWFRIPAGRSATFEVSEAQQFNSQIDVVWARRAGSSDSTSGGGITKRR